MVQYQSAHLIVSSTKEHLMSSTKLFGRLASLFSCSPRCSSVLIAQVFMFLSCLSSEFSSCSLDCFKVFLTLAGVFSQEGISKLWRGTNAGLALAVPTVCAY